MISVCMRQWCKAFLAHATSASGEAAAAAEVAGSISAAAAAEEEEEEVPAGLGGSSWPLRFV